MPDAFEIGLVMAGAVSAGAYTAGVIDFIYEALDAYYAARVQPDWNGPRHDVRNSHHDGSVGRWHDLRDSRAARVPRSRVGAAASCC